MAIGRTPDIWVGCRTNNVMSYSQLTETTMNIWRKKKMDFKIGKYRIRMGSFAWWCCIASGEPEALFSPLFSSPPTRASAGNCAAPAGRLTRRRACVSEAGRRCMSRTGYPRPACTGLSARRCISRRKRPRTARLFAACSRMS